MILCKTVSDLRRFITQCKSEQKTIGLVPTMGALHEGHASLIKASYAENDVTVVSVFVNPTQFGPNEDFDKYPRQLDDDCQVAKDCGADVVFAPEPEELYPNKDMTWVEVTGDVTKVLCGKSRPTHFRGVTTVVSKLMHLAQPNRAYFGQKDAQQAAVLQRMIDDLFFPLELRIMPIVRETDGLAKSSRNKYLTSEERKAALTLSQTLFAAQDKFAAGERDAEKILNFVIAQIKTEPLSDIDYVEMYGLPGLVPTGDTVTGKTLLAVAVRFGTTRLIDNVVLEAES